MEQKNQIDRALVTTAFEIDHYKVVKNFGITRGIIVRSRSLVGNIGAGIQTLFGGNITLYTALCEQAREHAFELMLEHAAEMGANGVIGFRYDATEIAGGVTEVLAYGTAVTLERA
ncbi:MAG TPA: YbjQ family protein [Candidatus Paceibacterota bacterium]|nr:YbjQ family protein [Candidatus Paceibacterota bacterium]